MGKTVSNKNGDLVKIDVLTLKKRLNRVYDTRKSKGSKSQDGLFEYLWDLKELALMEGRNSVEVPVAWLEEIDNDLLLAEPTYH